MKKVIAFFLGLAMLFMLAIEVHAAQDIIVLTSTSPDTIVATGTTAIVYGTSGANQVTIENGAEAKLLNFPGSNTINIESDPNRFTVLRSGATVTFRGNDGTLLTMPSTATAQSVIFQDGMILDLIINSQEVNLGGQIVSTDNTSLGYTITPLTSTGSYDANDNTFPQINHRGEVAFARDMAPGGASDPEIFLYSNGMITQITHNFRELTSDPYDTNFKLNDNGEILWKADDEGLQLYSNGVINQITDYSSWTPDFNNNGSIVFIQASTYAMMQCNNGVVSTILHYDNSWVPTNPKINDAGQIFFEYQNVDYWDYRPSEIFLLASGVSTQLTDNYTLDSDIVVSTGGEAVWVNHGDTSEVYQYVDGTTGKISTSFNNNLHMTTNARPDINDFGDVVWPAQGDIWLYSNGITTQITTEGTRGKSVNFPRINNYGLIVWITIEDTGWTTLYCYYKGEIIAIDAGKNGPSDDMPPQVNDRGQIAWCEYDSSSGWEIFLATPTTGPDLISGL